MSNKYTPIVGTLGFVLSPDQRRVLMVHRNARAKDDQFGKYNGLGGHMEPNEDVVNCMRREIHEEAGIDCTEITLRGTINWTGFGPKSENWLGFVFLITKFKGEPYTENEEGTLHWIEVDRLNELPMWEGDRYFLPMVFDEDPHVFHGFMPYENERPLNWTYTRL